MFNGTAGVEVFLYLCGVTILATVVIPNRRVDIGVQLRSFKLRLRSLPESEDRGTPKLRPKDSSQEESAANPEAGMADRE